MAENLRGVSSVNELQETRLWKTLDGITNRLANIEDKISQIVRLEERVNNHEQTLARYGNRLDGHDMRLHEAELWQASYGDRSSVERLIANVQSDLSDTQIELKKIKSNIDENRGKREISNAVYKWVAGVSATVLAAVILLILGA